MVFADLFGGLIIQIILALLQGFLGTTIGV